MFVTKFYEGKLEQIGQFCMQTFIDRVFLWRHKVAKTSIISKHIKIFHLDGERTKFILKFSYAGNIQYHKLTADEAAQIVSELS